MPDARLARTRASLPEGYQFGDGRGFRVWAYTLKNLGFRPLIVNSFRGDHWNVIEGEHDAKQIWNGIQSGDDDAMK